MLLSFKVLLLLAAAAAVPLERDNSHHDIGRRDDRSSFTLPLLPVSESLDVVSDHDKRGTLDLTTATPQYGIPATVGGKKNVVLILDTGSPITAVDSATAGDTPLTPVATQRWGPIFKDNIQYLPYQGKIDLEGKTDLHGNFYENKMTLDGVTIDQKFFVASNFPSSKYGNKLQGVMGFAFPFFDYIPPWWEVNSRLTDKRFSVYLPLTATEHGHVTFGKENPSCMVADTAQTVPVDMAGRNLGSPAVNHQTVNGKTIPKNWAITFGGVSQATRSFNAPQNTQALVDTGASIIYGPESQVERFYTTLFPGAQKNNDEKWIVRSQTAPPAPELVFHLGGKAVTWKPQDFWTQTKVTGEWVGLVGYKKAAKWWVLGQPFVRSFYTTFEADTDHDRFSVTFAERHKC